MKIKNVFNLKELYYFEIIFWLFLFYPTNRPNFLGGAWVMGNETFYWDGLKYISYTFRRICTTQAPFFKIQDFVWKGQTADLLTPTVSLWDSRFWVSSHGLASKSHSELKQSRSNQIESKIKPVIFSYLLGSHIILSRSIVGALKCLASKSAGPSCLKLS